MIEQLHQLNKEVTDLECKYNMAVEWLYKTRKEFITILSLVSRNDIEGIKENFLTSKDENWEAFKQEMNSYDYIIETLNKKV